MKLSGPKEAVARVEDRRVTGPGGVLALRIYTPADSAGDALPGLVYFHGGGMLAGSVATHDAIARALTNSSGCRVASVDYRLAPEYPFPAALEDAHAAVVHIASHAADFGIDSARLGICGDSAGGTLAAATAQAAARSGFPRLALQVLICPILDHVGTTGSRRDLARGYMIDQATFDQDLLHYLPHGTDAADPRVSPLRADDVAGVPRTLIHTAEYDPLRDEGRDYAERLDRARVAVSYTCHPGMIHLFYGLGGLIPHAQTALRQIGGEIRSALA